MGDVIAQSWWLVMAAALIVPAGGAVAGEPAMTCTECERPLVEPHSGHEPDCEAPTRGWCRCDRPVCASCCPVCAP